MGLAMSWGMTKTFLAALALLAVGCRTEPKGLQWTRDSVMAETFVMDGTAVEADGPVLVCALSANWAQARASMLAHGFTQAELDGATKGLTIRVVTGAECLSGVDSAQGPCTYAYSDYLGDGEDGYWQPPVITLNQRGTQLAHELLHVLKAWRNEGGNADHSRWTVDDWSTVDNAADQAYRVTPN